MDLIYENERWSDDLAWKHQTRMIAALDAYYGRTVKRSSSDALAEN
jgi:hypothetical protein